METLPTLRKMINGFLRQRKKAAIIIHAEDEAAGSTMEMTCVSLLKAFDFIRDWGYWRHCLEVKERRQQFESILPSETGKHATIRANILDMLDYCSAMASYPKRFIDAYELEKRNQHLQQVHK